MLQRVGHDRLEDAAGGEQRRTVPALFESTPAVGVRLVDDRPQLNIVNNTIYGMAAAGYVTNPDGSPLGERIFDATKAGTISTIDYSFPKPGASELVPKQLLVTRVGNQGCGVSYYK